MKSLIATMVLSLPLLASAQNLPVNGSFEDGLTGWAVVNGPGTLFPVSTVTCGVLPGAFNEIVPPDNAAGNLSPDAAGTRGLYFVDDAAIQTLTQQFVIAEAGACNLGFSY